VLCLNDVIKDECFELNATSFKTIRLPNEGNFPDDDRDTTERARWRNNPCMTDCLPGPAKISGRARVIDGTPEPGKGPKVE
jgi:cytochrome c